MPIAQPASSPADRAFRDIPQQANGEIASEGLFNSAFWPGALDWDELLKSQRILIVGQAGAGKTFECRAQAKRLNAAGQPAFFIELADLATDGLEQSFGPVELARFLSWRKDASETATFFLDAVDELRLTATKFGTAVRRFSAALEGTLPRARIVITTRPIPFDRNTVEEYLPVPSASRPPLTFAERVTTAAMPQQAEAKIPAVRHVVLLPLTDAQIRAFAVQRGVHDADRLVRQIEETGALELARRPQDLIEMCQFWLEHGKLGTHRELIHQDIVVKLKAPARERDDDPLTPAKAWDGAT